MYDVINNYGKEIENYEEIEKYIEYLVKELNLDNCMFNIIFITNKEIHKITKEYRNVDRPTDVISFALEDNKDIEYKDFRLLGDIYISVDRAIEQARDYNHSLKRELCFLSTHGILHLLGYDHQTKKEEEIMFTKQKELLEKYGIQRN